MRTTSRRRVGRSAGKAGRVRAPGSNPYVHVDDQTQPLSFEMTLRLLGCFKPHRRDYAWVCMAGLVIALLELVPPRLVGYCIDLLSAPLLGRDRGAGGEGLPFGVLSAVALGWLAVIAVTQALHGRQILLANRAGERVLAALRQRMFDQLQRLPMAYFDRTHVGRIIARMSGDIDALRNVVIWGLNTLVANAVTLVLAAAMIAHLDIRLFLAVVWLVPVMMVLSFVYARRVGAAWQFVRVHSTRVSSNQAENIAGVQVVTAFNRQERNLKHYTRLQERNTVNNVAASRLSGVFQPALQWVRFTGQAIILLYGGSRIASGSLNAGEVVAVALYWECFMQPAVVFGSFLNELLLAMAGAERIFALLDEKPDAAEREGARALPPLRGRVEFESVSFGYRPGRPVLDDVSFVAEPGSTVALVGHTGSGKSTIISLLSRFYYATSGRILLDGCDIRDARADSLQRQTAIVLQNNYLFSGTVMENLRYVRPDATDEVIIEAARTLGCHERIQALQHGYETRVGEKGASLSLGERQLICFTRALVADPRILLLDEATSAVDPAAEDEIRRAIGKLTANRTTFIVAHRLSTIRGADLILVLDQGRIVERGTHAELIAAGGRYAGLHFSQGTNVAEVSPRNGLRTRLQEDHPLSGSPAG